MSQVPFLQLVADENIPKHQIPNRLTHAERHLMQLLSQKQRLITCIGNIGVGKSSLVKFLAFHTGMNALFELPDEGFEDHLTHPPLYPLLATSKDAAKRVLGRYYGAINAFLETQKREKKESPLWLHAKKHLEQAALDIQHAYLDLRKMQLQAIKHFQGSTCIDGYPMADRFAFCEVLHREMDEPYLTDEALKIIDDRLEKEFRHLPKPDLLIILKGPVEVLLENIGERERKEEQNEKGLPEGLIRLVKALNKYYENFAATLRETHWYEGPVLEIDISKIDFVSNVRHLIAVFEGVERLLSGNSPS